LSAFSRALAPLLLAASLTGCLDVGLPTNLKAGFLTQSAHSDGASGYVMAPEATFYANINLAANPVPQDSCFIAPYTNSTGSTTVFQTIEAGPVIFTRVAGVREDSLFPVVSGGQLSYRPRVGERIPFIPGDSLEITVPGAPVGFPSVVTKTRTSEAFTHDPIAIPTTASPITFTWTAAPQPGSTMILSLRYANATSTGGVNEQIYCGFIDDGSGTIPASLTDGWVNALDGRRDTRASRYRQQLIQINANQRFTFISLFTQPLPPLPPGF